MTEALLPVDKLYQNVTKCWRKGLKVGKSLAKLPYSCYLCQGSCETLDIRLTETLAHSFLRGVSLLFSRSDWNAVPCWWCPLEIDSAQRWSWNGATALRSRPPPSWVIYWKTSCFYGLKHTIMVLERYPKCNFQTEMQPHLLYRSKQCI